QSKDIGSYAVHFGHRAWAKEGYMVCAPNQGARAKPVRLPASRTFGRGENAPNEARFTLRTWRGRRTPTRASACWVQAGAGVGAAWSGRRPPAEESTGLGAASNRVPFAELVHA